MTFCETLKKLRIRNNYSQIDLAKEMNVRQYVISSWETGRSEPSIKQIIELSKIFNIPCDYLLGKDEIIVSSEKDFLRVVEEFLEDSSDELEETIQMIVKNANKEEKKEITNILKSLYNLTNKG
ncbi:MAG: helix-turn-helix transcriptional regulator [Bacilli bacterium]|nr:helix-turn-helix transcriptional regulator [Bacilli bacterium]